jgi:hypothetical protein
MVKSPVVISRTSADLAVPPSGSRELCRGGLAAPGEPQVFDLLLYLIRHRERVVSRDELIGTVWNGRINAARRDCRHFASLLPHTWVGLSAATPCPGVASTHAARLRVDPWDRPDSLKYATPTKPTLRCRPTANLRRKGIEA